MEYESSINRCYQCMTCTLGCPVAARMDIVPHRIIRKAQMRENEALLRCGSIWQCLGCETCFSRCPNDINIPSIIDGIKHTAILEKKTGKNIAPRFHHIFLSGVKKNGLLFELGLMLTLKIVMKDFFSDIFMGAKMIFKGKLSLRSHSILERGAMKKIFEKSKAE